MILCPSCQADADAWTAYVSVPPIKIHTIGDRHRDALDSRRYRAEDHYALVNRQLDLIRTICAQQHQVGRQVAA